MDGFMKGDVGKQRVDIKDAINKPASCLQVILANLKESFKVNSLEVRCRNKGTKNSAYL